MYIEKSRRGQLYKQNSPVNTMKTAAIRQSAKAQEKAQNLIKSGTSMLKQGMQGMKKKGRKPKVNPLSGYEAEMKKENSNFGTGWGN